MSLCVSACHGNHNDVIIYMAYYCFGVMYKIYDGAIPGYLINRNIVALERLLPFSSLPPPSLSLSLSLLNIMESMGIRKLTFSLLNKYAQNKQVL